MLLDSEKILQLLNNGWAHLDFEMSEEDEKILIITPKYPFHDLSEYSIHITEFECILYKNKEEVFCSKDFEEGFSKVVELLTIETKPGLKEKMLKALNNEDLDLLESLINLL